MSASRPSRLVTGVAPRNVSATRRGAIVKLTASLLFIFRSGLFMVQAMTTHRKMHLVAFLLAGPTAHHHGAWRHPEADLGFFTPEWHEHIARVLEQGKFDSLFFADILGLYDLYGGSFATILRCGGQMGLLDPIPLLSIMSRVTSRIGLGATLSSTFYPPYHLARSLGTLDLLSGGRVAWNVVASHGHLEAQNFGLTELPARDTRYDHADEVVEAVCGCGRAGMRMRWCSTSSAACSPIPTRCTTPTTRGDGSARAVR